jgi:hypothetical protein
LRAKDLIIPDEEELEMIEPKCPSCGSKRAFIDGEWRCPNCIDDGNFETEGFGYDWETGEMGRIRLSLPWRCSLWGSTGNRPIQWTAKEILSETRPFSLGSAKECVDILFKALPKSRQMEHIGTLNEIFVPLERAIAKLGKDWTGDKKDWALILNLTRFENGS